METIFVVDIGSRCLKYGTIRKQKRGGALAPSQQTPTASIAWTPMDDDEHLRAWDAPELTAPRPTTIPTLAKLLASSTANMNEYTLLCLVHPLATRRSKELLVRGAFEELAAKRVYVGYSPFAALSSFGVTSGTVVDVGYHHTTITPVANGVPMVSAVDVVAGQGIGAVDWSIAQLIANHPEGRGYFPSALQLWRQHGEYLHAIKSEACMLPQGTQSSAAGMFPSGSSGGGDGAAGGVAALFSLPDGGHLRCPIGQNDVVHATQRLLDGTSLAFSAQNAILNLVFKGGAGILSRQSSWILTGGGAAVSGVESYFLEVLSAKASLGGKDVYHQQVRDPWTAAWSGGTILAQLSTLPTLCIDRPTYEECGPREALRYNAADMR